MTENAAPFPQGLGAIFYIFLGIIDMQWIELRELPGVDVSEISYIRYPTHLRTVTLLPFAPENGHTESSWNPDGNRENRLFWMYTIGRRWE